MDETRVYDLDLINDKEVERILIDVSYALSDRGYDPISQLVGYLTSGDPGYISSHLEARNKIQQIDRNTIVEVLLKNYMGDKN